MRWEKDTLWMHTGDEGIMDDEGYLRSKFSQTRADHLFLNVFRLVVGRRKVRF